MKERIKAIRRYFDLTQQEFADRIHSVQNTITGYETGRREPSNQMIALICREFGVSEKWLRTGDGPMLAPAPVSILDQLAEERNLSDAERLFVEKFLTLPASKRSVILDFMTDFANSLSTTAEGKPQAPPGSPESVAEAEAAYEKSSGIVRGTEQSASSTSGEIRDPASGVAG